MNCYPSKEENWFLGSGYQGLNDPAWVFIVVGLYIKLIFAAHLK
jgi:hypothetical protein